MSEDKQWLTVAEAAKQSGYSIRTLQKGLVEGWKPGHDWFTTLDAVSEYKRKLYCI